MANFEDNLDARINEAEEKGKLNDSLYNKYVQFVGALEALPRNYFNDDKLSSDIHDIHGRVKPFSQWPTKTAREKSQKVWLNYNQRLQLQQAAQEAGLEGDTEEDPSENPDFISQMLDTCVRTSMRTGLDKQTAFRHCSRQVKKYEHAIRMAISDKGLPKKEMEEFVNDLLKGMANGKQIDMKDMSIEDRQFIQDLKDSLSYKKPDTGIKEDLDDKDTFRNPCNYYDCDNRPDSEQFHKAHTVAFDNARKTVVPRGMKFSDVMQKEMAKFGYQMVRMGRPVKGGTPFDDRDWMIKEDVDTAQSIMIGDLELKVGDWVELGPVAKSTPGEGLDDRDEFGSVGLPLTPVKIMRIVPGGSWAYRNSPQHIASYTADYGVPPMRFAVTLSNSELLSLPDKSGVRWHGRPKHFVPTWYEEWWKKYGDDTLTKLYQDGELRKVDNIQEWFHSQPEK